MIEGSFAISNLQQKQSRFRAGGDGRRRSSSGSRSRGSCIVVIEVDVDGSDMIFDTFLIEEEMKVDTRWLENESKSGGCCRTKMQILSEIAFSRHPVYVLRRERDGPVQLHSFTQKIQ